jgi:hypothetical protein
VEETNMGAGVPQSTIKRHLRKMANKYSGVEFRVLYASNGEVAILPVNPETGEAECTNPQRFLVKYLWNKMCAHDKIDPKSNFVVFSVTNPFAKEYNEAVAKLQGAKPNPPMVGK